MSVRLPRKARLGLVVEYKQDGAYMVSPTQAPLAAGNVKSWKSILAKGFMALTAGVAALQSSAIGSNNQDLNIATTYMPAMHPQPFAAPVIDPAMEHVIPNRITIYGTP